MTVTDMQEIKTASIQKLTTGKDGGQDVLLVSLKEAYQSKPQYQRALKKEFDRCKDFDHQHLLKCLAMKDVEELGTCIEMEWEDSRSLLEYLDEGHSEDEKKRVISQIASALEYLHGNGMVHGALDPTFIFVTKKTDEVKVLNLRLRYADSMSMPNSSLRFIAPEAKDGTVTLDARADVYSLGMIVKAMNLGSEYDQVIDGSCSFGRSERYASIEDFMEAFEHHRYSRKSETTSSPVNRKMVGLVAAIAVLVVIAVVLLFSRGGQSDQQTASNDSTEIANNEQSQSTDTSSNSVSGAVASSPDSTDNAQQAAAQTPQYTGDLVFLNNLVPQMHIDIDKIYASSTDPDQIHKKVAIYYKGLRKTLGSLNEEQFAAFDKAFSDYIKSKQ
jgi:serine/threonine protein kinase